MPNKKLNPRRHEEIVRLRNAEELFAKLNAQGKRTRESIEDERLKTTQPYTPPSNILAARKHEVECKGRDIESLRRHIATVKGLTDDDALRMKFGGGDARAGVSKLGSPQTGEPRPVVDSAPSMTFAGSWGKTRVWGTW
jgi:hypothetical protein